MTVLWLDLESYSEADLAWWADRIREWDGQRRDVWVYFNNDGGGIFRYLPIAAHTDVFDRCFTTPHGRTFAPIAAAFGIRCEVPRTREETAQAASRALQHAGATLIEVHCTAESSESVRTSLAKASTAALLREFK